MHWIDYAIIAAVLASALFGAARGFLLEAAGIVGVFLGLYVARENYFTATGWLSVFFPKDQHLALVSFFLVTALVWLLVVLLAQTLSMAIRFTPVGGLNRFGGFVLGAVIGAVLVQALLVVGMRSSDPSIRSTIHSSRLASALRESRLNVAFLVPGQISPSG